MEAISSEVRASMIVGALEQGTTIETIPGAALSTVAEAAAILVEASLAEDGFFRSKA